MAESDRGGSEERQSDQVGSLGRELFELMRVMASEQGGTSRHGAGTDEEHGARRATDGPGPADGLGPTDGGSTDATPERHRCPHGWCPLCGVVEVLRDHPELVERVTDAAADLLRAVRDVTDHMSTHGGAHARRER